jgi:hypothetical protein
MAFYEIENEDIVPPEIEVDNDGIVAPAEPAEQDVSADAPPLVPIKPTPLDIDPVGLGKLSDVDVNVEKIPVDLQAFERGMPALKTGEYIPNPYYVELVNEDGSLSNPFAPDVLKKHIVENTPIPARSVRAYTIDLRTMEINPKDINAAPEGPILKSSLRESFLMDPFVYASKLEAESAQKRYIKKVKELRADKDGFSVLVPTTKKKAWSNITEIEHALADDWFSLENASILMYRIIPETGELQKTIARGREEAQEFINEKRGIPFKPMDRDGRAYEAKISFANEEAKKLIKLRNAIYGKESLDTMAQQAVGAVSFGLIPWITSLPLVHYLRPDLDPEGRIVISPAYAQAGRVLANPASALVGTALGAVVSTKIPVPKLARVATYEKKLADTISSAIGVPELAAGGTSILLRATEFGAAGALFTATDPTLSSEEILTGFGTGAVLGAIFGASSGSLSRISKSFEAYRAALKGEGKRADLVTSFATVFHTGAKKIHQRVVNDLIKQLEKSPTLMKKIEKHVNVVAKGPDEEFIMLAKGTEKAPPVPGDKANYLKDVSRNFEVRALGYKLAEPTGLQNMQIIPGVVPNPGARMRAWELLTDELTEAGLSRGKAKKISEMSISLSDKVRKTERMLYSELQLPSNKDMLANIRTGARMLSKEIRKEMASAFENNISVVYEKLYAMDKAVCSLNKSFILDKGAVSFLGNLSNNLSAASRPALVLKLSRDAERKLGPVFDYFSLQAAEYYANVDNVISTLIGRPASAMVKKDVAAAQATLFNTTAAMEKIQVHPGGIGNEKMSIENMLLGSAADRESISVMRKWLGAKPLRRKLSEITVAEALLKGGVATVAPETLVAFGFAKVGTFYARRAALAVSEGLVLAMRHVFDDSLTGLASATAKATLAAPGTTDDLLDVLSGRYTSSIENASKDLDAAHKEINAGNGKIFIDRAIKYMEELRGTLTNFDSDNDHLVGALLDSAPSIAMGVTANMGGIYANVMNALPRSDKLPTTSEMNRFADYAAVAFSPGIVALKLNDRSLNAVQLESFMDNYPNMFAKLAETVDTLFNDSKIPPSTFVRKLHNMIFGVDMYKMDLLQQNAVNVPQQQLPRKMSAGAKKAAINANLTPTQGLQVKLD